MFTFRVLVLLVPVFELVRAQQTPTWSICNGLNGFGNCFNSIVTGDCSTVYNLNVVSASVEGMFLFYANDYSGGQENNAIGRFLFGSTFGLNYTLVLGDGISKVNCIRRVGDQYNHKLSTLTTFGRLEFLTDNFIGIIYDDMGSPGDCSPYPVASLIISGNEDWTIYRNDGSSACLRPTDSSSFVPALLRDTREIGFELNSTCSFKKGCHSEEIYYLDNHETTGVLMRTE